MMKLQKMFQKNINRDINGVIKVTQNDESSLKQELSEYIITRELRRHFRTFFDNYAKTIDQPTDKIGVWISGFFGSGKSHFLKMLSYLLANEYVGGRKALDYFQDKFDDPMMYATAVKCVSVPTESILFNIDIEGPITKDKTAVLRVFAKMFYDHCGFYGDDLKIAKLERFIEKQGKTEQFRKKFEEVNGAPWVETRDSFAFFEDDVVEVLKSVLGMSEQAARNWFNGEETNELSIAQLCADIKEYVDSKGKNFRLLFMVDEVGQYIGDDGDLMINLQSLVEEIGTQCRGKVWVMVTSQEAIDSVATLNLFSGEKLGDHCTIKSGIVTGNNDLFLKLWYEINFNNIGFRHKTFTDNSNIKWVPMHKGGGYRKHYGLHEYIMNLHDIWEPSKTNVSVRRGDPNFYFKEGLTWSTLSNNLSVRRSPSGFVFDTKGSMCFVTIHTNIGYLEALLNSKVAALYMSILSPTLDFNQGAMAKIPYIFSEEKENAIVSLSNQCVALSKADWDSFETSWDFTKHPLVTAHCPLPTDHCTRITDHYKAWEKECNDRFAQLKANEEELNRIFIDIYGLQDELTPEVEDKNVTVRKADHERDIRSLISYAVGCMFGRYSLDADGLIFAGEEWDASKYTTFPADKDNIIPICDDDYFDDDITGRFVKWVEVVYGRETLEENLKFIADALGGRGTSREVIRNYFLNDFYADHCKVYQKRPIYWLFDSGKKNGFKALIYMHRYQSDLLARLRTDYVHEQQERYRTQLSHLADAIEHASASERVKLTKQQKKIQEQALEIQQYEEKVHHLADQNIPIDLDDGVKHNYELFADVLAKIK